MGKNIHEKGADGIRHYERNRKQNWHDNWIYINTAGSRKKTKIMNATVTTTSVTQTGNEVLGTKEKKLYYFIVETPKGKLVVNVGEKTHDEIRRLTLVEKDPNQQEIPLTADEKLSAVTEQIIKPRK